jgi:hypothetical protein
MVFMAVPPRTQITLNHKRLFTQPLLILFASSSMVLSNQPVESHIRAIQTDLSDPDRPSFNFINAPIDRVVSFYNKISGKSVVHEGGNGRPITLDSGGAVTRSEAIALIEMKIMLQGYSLIPESRNAVSQKDQVPQKQAESYSAITAYDSETASVLKALEQELGATTTHDGWHCYDFLSRRGMATDSLQTLAVKPSDPTTNFLLSVPLERSTENFATSIIHVAVNGQVDEGLLSTYHNGVLAMAARQKLSIPLRGLNSLERLFATFKRYEKTATANKVVAFEKTLGAPNDSSVISFESALFEWNGNEAFLILSFYGNRLRYSSREVDMIHSFIPFVRRASKLADQKLAEAKEQETKTRQQIEELFQ